MKKYENPELLEVKYEADESIADLDISGTYDDSTNADKDSWDNIFGNN